MLLIIISLLVSGATPQLQPGQRTRSNLSQSGMRCTPNDACPYICDKVKGKDGKCEDGKCMCTFCYPCIPSKRPIGGKGLMDHN
ncbi:hypothetical protein SEVIR_1G136000v4 [Setaria viridis]|uniref:Knottin scorpion toxin-like domain-containing protein n=1 Tax=Setaria viridis TaxID=4556 RepID=A0A4U6WAD5_SETVI|nr:hypothetical protein SEVIR_1G136000v2 [Setaria viridis]